MSADIPAQKDTVSPYAPMSLVDTATQPPAHSSDTPTQEATVTPSLTGKPPQEKKVDTHTLLSTTTSLQKESVAASSPKAVLDTPLQRRDSATTEFKEIEVPSLLSRILSLLGMYYVHYTWGEKSYVV